MQMGDASSKPAEEGKRKRRRRQRGRCCFPVRALDEQEIPALHLHDIPPVDVRLWSLGRDADGRLSRLGVGLEPDLVEKARDATKAAIVGQVTELNHAVLEEAPEARAGDADGATDEIDPDQRAVEARGPGGDVLEHGGELLDEADAARLAGVEAGDQAAEVDAGGETEGDGHVLAQLLGAQAVVGIEGDLGRGLADLGQADLVAKDVDVLAEGDVVHAVPLERLEAGDLRDEVHDAVLAAHQLAQAQRGIRLRQMLRPVGMSEGRGAALHGGTEDVDPGGEGHVERGLRERRVGIRNDGGKLELLDEGDGCLEVLVPSNVREGVVEAADRRLEDDQPESGLEDLLVVLVLVERVAQRGDGGVSMPHDVAVDRLVVREAGVGFVMLRRDAQAAVQVALVALQGGKDEVRADGSVLVRLEDREQIREDELEEMIQEPLVALVELDGNLPCVPRRAVREVKEVHVEGLLGQRFPPLRVHLLCPLAFQREGRQDGARRWWGVVGAEGGRRGSLNVGMSLTYICRSVLTSIS